MSTTPNPSRKWDSSLRGRSGIVTGAARGIGLATAESLIARGARVWVVDRDEDALADVFPKSGPKSRSVWRLCLDLGEERGCEQLLQRVISKGSVDFLVNNASPALADPILRESFFEGVRQSLGVTGHLCRLFAEEMARSGGGVIVNVGSIAGVIASGSDWYSAAKTGIVGLTREIAAQFGPAGVRVNAVAPGVIETRRTRRFIDDRHALQRVVASIPLRRVGTPDDVAGVISFLIGDQASYVTGATVVVDGGLTVTSVIA